jgi:hypothetical protein
MFADMPLDNLTVDQTRLLPPVLARGPLEKRRRSTKRPKISSRLIVL